MGLVLVQRLQTAATMVACRTIGSTWVAFWLSCWHGRASLGGDIPARTLMMRLRVQRDGMIEGSAQWLE